MRRILRLYAELSFGQIVALCWGPGLYCLLAAWLLRRTGDGPTGIAAQIILGQVTILVLALLYRARLARRKLHDIVDRGRG